MKLPKDKMSVPKSYEIKYTYSVVFEVSGTGALSCLGELPLLITMGIVCIVGKGGHTVGITLGLYSQFCSTEQCGVV